MAEAPSLVFGSLKMADWRRIFLPGDNEIEGSDKLEMDRFYTSSTSTIRAPSPPAPSSWTRCSS